MFLGQTSPATPITGRLQNDSISDFSTDSNSNSFNRDEPDLERKKRRRSRKKSTTAERKNKMLKEKGTNILLKVQEAQVVNYLCHLFEGAGHGEERIDHKQIEAVYEQHSNFQECYEKLKERVQLLQNKHEVAHYIKEDAKEDHEGEIPLEKQESENSIGIIKKTNTMGKTVISGLESDSDIDDNCQWSYVWPKDLVRYFLKINNQTSPIAEKYDEFRLKPLEAVQKEIDSAQLNLFYAHRTGDENAVMEKIDDLKELQGKYQHEEEKAEDKIFKHLNNDEMIDEMIDLHGQQIEKGISLAIEHLKRVQNALSQGLLKPNWRADQHLYKIICGAGTHSRSGIGMMKLKLKEQLEKMHLDYHDNMNHGVFLVRFTIRQQ